MATLQGKRAAITGAASGIGFAIAGALAGAGAETILIDLEQGKAEAAAARIPSAAGTPLAVACDVANEGSVQDAFARLPGPLDILITCAGIAHVGNALSTTPEDMDRLYRVNVRGTYLCMRAALPGMLARGGGALLNMASIAATRGLSDRFAYSMTKGAVLSMTLSVAKDYIMQGIRCNCLSPARVHTPFVDGFLRANYPGQESEKMKELSASQPIGRMGEPDEIARLALFLCSDDAGFITGCDYPIDGGFMNLR